MFGVDIYYGLARGEDYAYSIKINKNINLNKPKKVANYLAMYLSFNRWEKGIIYNHFPGAVKMLRENGYKVTIGKSADGNDQIVITAPDGGYYYSTYPNTEWIEKLMSDD